MELPQPAVECGEEARAGHINGGYSRQGSRGMDKYDSSKYEPRFHREVSHAVMQSCSGRDCEYQQRFWYLLVYGLCHQDFCLYLSVSKIFFYHVKKI